MTRVLLPLLALLLLAPAVGAQSLEEPQYMSFDSGDLDYRTHTHASLVGTSAPSALFIPDQGLTARIFLARADGEPGWVYRANDHGWNSFALDMVGCGDAPALPDDDLLKLVEKGIWGVLQMGVAPSAEVVIAQGVSAAYAIKARATDRRSSKAAVLIDPVGPPGAQPMLDMTAQQLWEWSRSLEEHLWVRWGLGPKLGESYPGANLGEAEFARLMADYERDQPPYWAAALTGLDAGLEVREPANLVEWPVLVVRSPHRTPEEVERIESVTAWLRERGARVETLDLASLNLPGLTALPMLDPHADALLERFLTWATGVQPKG